MLDTLYHSPEFALFLGYSLILIGVGLFIYGVIVLWRAITETEWTLDLREDE